MHLVVVKTMFLSTARGAGGLGEGTLQGTVRSLPVVAESRNKVAIPAQVQHEYDDDFLYTYPAI